MKNTLIVLLPLLLASCVFVDHGPADIQVLKESRPIGNAKELEVELKLDVGEIEVERTSDDNLFAFDLEYDRNRYNPQFNFNEGDRATLRLAVESTRDFGSHGKENNDLRVRLTDKIPLDLNLTTGVSESRLELTGLKIRRMHLRGGVGKTEVSIDKPSGQVMSSLDIECGVGELIINGLGNAQVQQVDLKGGVGHAELDFSGELGNASIDATVKVGIGAVRITVPRDADVEIEAEGSFLSNISAPSFEKSGRTYTHRGGGGAKIRIKVESGIGGVEVELI